MDSALAVKLIEKCFPEIKVRHSREILVGWENLVLEVNGEYVFRFPKFRETETRFIREVKLLPMLSRHLSTRVPDYKFVWKGGREYRHWFGGYPRLDGVTLSNRALRKKWDRRLAGQIAQFLKELHGIEAETEKIRVTRISNGTLASSMLLHFRRIRRIVYPLITASLRAGADSFWKDLLADFENADFIPALIHGDLGAENLLFDPRARRLTGVLDWSYAQIGDPALEFAHLFIYDPSVGQDVLRCYGSLGRSFERRIQFYVDSEPFYDVMWGVVHHWEKATKLGMRNLRRATKEWA